MTAQLDCQRLCHVHKAGIAGAAAEGLPALRALPPLMLMMRPQPSVFMKGMTAREQRSAPTYFTLKSCSKSSSMTVSIGPVAVAEPGLRRQALPL